MFQRNAHSYQLTMFEVHSAHSRIQCLASFVKGNDLSKPKKPYCAVQSMLACLQSPSNQVL